MGMIACVYEYKTYEMVKIAYPQIQPSKVSRYNLYHDSLQPTHC